MFEIRQEDNMLVHYVWGTKSNKVFFRGKAEECLNWIREQRHNFLRQRNNAQRRAKDQAMRDLGMHKVYGALGGVYYE